jgi:hypothetical protein
MSVCGLSHLFFSSPTSFQILLFILECTIFNFSSTIPLYDYYRGKKDTKASIRLSRDGKELDFTVVRKPFRLKGDRFGEKLFEKCALFCFR